MKTRLTIAAVALFAASAFAQPALLEPPEFSSTLPGPGATHVGLDCFHLASGSLVPGDLDWIQITIPVASTSIIVDVDIVGDTGNSAVLAVIVSGATTFNADDGNNARDAACGSGPMTVPVGNPQDSAVSFGANPRDTVIDILITGGEDGTFDGSHNQQFDYDVWVLVEPVPCMTDADCDDGVICTLDLCDLTTGVCGNTPDDGACDNAMFCDGVERCDAVLDCQTGAAPTCDDGVSCTTDACDPAADACTNAPDDGACDNGVFCDGAERCDSVNDCQPGVPPACDDGVVCTVDTCDPATDSCVNAPDDAACNNGVFCDGVEVCDPAADCLVGQDPCPGQFCLEGETRCVDCLTDADCDDGVFCTGAEGCDASGACQPGGAPCPPGEACNPITDACESAGGLTLDIKPGACPNKYKPDGRSFLRAAIVASSGFDVSLIDLESLQLTRADGIGGVVLPNDGPPGPRSMIADVSAPVAVEPCDCAEASPDGLADVTLVFAGKDVVMTLQLDATSPGDLIALTVSGMLLDGSSFAVTDCVTIQAVNGRSR